MSADGKKLVGTGTSLAVAGGSVAAVGGPVGWVVGGTLAASGGVVALVGGIKNRKVNKARAIAWAKKLGLPEPGKVRGFIVRLMKKDAAWRRKKLARDKKWLRAIKKRQSKWKKHPGGRRTLQVLSLGIMRGPQRLRKRATVLEGQIALIEALQIAQKEKRAARRSEAKRVDLEEREMEIANEAALAAATSMRNKVAGVVVSTVLLALFGGIFYAVRRKKK
jgi:hypothetical protein